MDSTLFLNPELNKQEARNTQLIDAASAGNTFEVEWCLGAGAQINAIARSMTALMAAAEHGHAQTVRFLIASGAPLDTRSPLKNTALIYAAIDNRTEVVDILIKAGADIYCQNYYGNTALFLAIVCKKEHADINSAFRLLSAMTIPDIVAIQDNPRCKEIVDQFKAIVLKNQKVLLEIFREFIPAVPQQACFLDLPIELMIRIFSEAELFEQWYSYCMPTDIVYLSENRAPMTFLPLANVTETKKRKVDNDLEEELKSAVEEMIEGDDQEVQPRKVKKTKIV